MMMPDVATIDGMRRWLGRELRAAGIEEAALEADLLLGHFLACGRAALVLRHDERLPPPLVEVLRAAAQRRQAREPLAHILGEWEFRGLPFAVSRAVLIPRPETELLVDLALAPVNMPAHGWQDILDLGTGSGILAITLALACPAARVIAVDRSAAALSVARANAQRHRVADRVNLVQSDWLAALKPGALFDLVVANPPYVASGELAGLQPEVARFEPRLALDGGPQGLDQIHRLASALPAVMKPGALLLMEIGWDQRGAVLALFGAAPDYEGVMVKNDLAGRPRLLMARRPHEG